MWPRGGAAALPQVQPPGSSSPGARKGPHGGALAGQPETSQRGAGSLQSRSLGQVHYLSGSVHCPVCPPGSASGAPGALAAWCHGRSCSPAQHQQEVASFRTSGSAIPGPAVMRQGASPPPLHHCVSASCHTDSFRGVRSQATADFIAASVCIWSYAGGRGGQL